ncbi:DHS-like NAD/FAD-binding domain-containing protein [Schizophyllum amplum]|uniref:DHS-like NAD/FAD-binding domain-containing protein n=1 Tax=Schizophyllum amplum TaxID=97359 RepID=A0A550CGY1_9AGAR|nr:DHS-like NAD/FAD-binding domain-containing protein [Auriculariopsis ampla]
MLTAQTGVSTAAGIPDFRSPDTVTEHSSQATLSQRYHLPFPEAMFSIDYFREHPEPCEYTLLRVKCHLTLPIKYKPTLTHAFITLLARKRKLRACFTQNIDTLERRAGVPSNRLIEAHGSVASHHCIDCRASYPDDAMKACIARSEIPRCLKCGGIAKPDVVFFGEGLPLRTFMHVPIVPFADLLIVLGTSLNVMPFAALARLPTPLCPRVLINNTRAGMIGTRKDDLVLLGECDAIVRDLCRELGWEDELVELWRRTQGEDSVDIPRGEDMTDDSIGIMFSATLFED